ncbi:MAG: VWA domain-containing protein [Candidatus Micrarchaeia archaeon]
MKGLVFTLEALSALLLLLTLSYALSLSTSTSAEQGYSHEGLHTLAQDSIGALSKLRLRDVRRDPAVARLFEDGSFSEANNNDSVMAALGSLWATNNTGNATLARELAQTLMTRVMPSHVNWAVAFEGDIIYNTSAPAPERSLAASRRIVSGVNSSQPSTGCVARAFLQRIRGKNERAYAFFGGFVGQGNITAVLRGISADAAFNSLVVELNAGNDFNLVVNGFDCGELHRADPADNYSVDSWTVTDEECLSQLDATASENNVSLNFTQGGLAYAYVGGGFVEAVYETSEITPTWSTMQRTYLPGIQGLANYYGSFYVPGQLTGINATLHFYNNYTSYFRVGNKTVMHNRGSANEQVIFIPYANFSANFTDAELSSRTVPVRFEVFANATGQTGYADVVLITDVSGSMNWKMSTDYQNGVIRACDNPALYDSDTQRLSVAKCVDKSFVQAILEGVGNQIALVSFSSSVSSYTNFSTDYDYLESEIDGYTQGGGTCIACAINKARELLANSAANRTRYIIVMSDGVPNYRSTEFCGEDWRAVSANGSSTVLAADYNAIIGRRNATGWALSDISSASLYGVSLAASDNAFAVGSSGKIYKWNGAAWAQSTDTGLNTHYAVDYYNPNVAFAAGSTGKVFRWNGAAWAESTDTGDNVHYAVDVLNSSWVFTVGSSGKIFRWNGAAWAESTDTGSNTFYGVAVHNGTLGFAVGDSGKIYRWNGAAWAQNIDTGSNTHYAVAAYNGTLAFAVGSSGIIYKWNGAAWAQDVSPTGAALRGIAFQNGSAAKAVGSNVILSWNGSGWSVERSYACDQGNSSTGVSCSDNDDCSLSTSCPSRNANYSSCWAHQEYGAVVYAVGFGPVASCAFANATLNAIAQCGNGTYFASSDAAELADFYRSLARTIVTESNASQVLSISGSINSTLFPDSFIEYSFIPDEPDYDYGDLSVTVENPPLPSCSGSVYFPTQIKLDSVRVTSYSGDKWTDLVRVRPEGGAWVEAFNLSKYAMDYEGLGDPFAVQFNTSLITTGGYSEFSVRTGSAYGNASAECPSDDRVIYTGRLRAQVNYSGVYPVCASRNATVYYDLDYDNVADGSIGLTIGSAGLPSAGEEYVDVAELEPGTNAVDDALVRLLDALNFLGDGDEPSGSAANPIDLKIGESINLTVIVGQGVPFMWGPSEVSVMVWN